MGNRVEKLGRPETKGTLRKAREPKRSPGIPKERVPSWSRPCPENNAVLRGLGMDALLCARAWQSALSLLRLVGFGLFCSLLQPTQGYPQIRHTHIGFSMLQGPSLPSEATRAARHRSAMLQCSPQAWLMVRKGPYLLASLHLHSYIYI